MEASIPDITFLTKRQKQERSLLGGPLIALSLEETMSRLEHVDVEMSARHVDVGVERMEEVDVLSLYYGKQRRRFFWLYDAKC
ncbi:hypothetical protein Tco_1364629 [Tanacetum coccineum]